MKIFFRFLILLISTALLCSGWILPASAGQSEQTDPYTQELIDKGFPAAYAQKLTELHYLHPTWEFEPLLITQMNSQYTWEYVLNKETENPKTNLINKNSAYTAYRHATNTELYDSGWYQASYETVSYFMDPENFLNEKDIFMFRDLKFSETITVEIVEAALSGTFMSNTVLYDDVTYAAYLVQTGKTLNVDPLHLAARLRQEQGASGNSPLIKGLCGDKLWYYYENQIQTENDKQVLAPASGHTQQSLLAYNGLYNYFNIGAAGTGYFEIYLGAMKEAQKGTAEMAEAWGGSGAWDTPAKAIYGGAYKLTHKYVDDYQNTLYLQKFNVDPRSSRNFWGQYMQNVGAALSEARTSFNSLYSLDCLELPYHFLIPIYQGKPAANPDPAGGTCDTYAAANSLVSYETKLTAPVQTDAVMNSMLYVNGLIATEGEALTLQANAFATLAYDAFFVSVNGNPATQADSEHDTAAKPELIETTAPGQYPNTLRFDCSAFTVGNYTIAIYGRLANPGKGCPHHLLAVIHLQLQPAPEITTEETTTEEMTTEEITTEERTTTEATTEKTTTETAEQTTAKPPVSQETERPSSTQDQANPPIMQETPTYGEGAAQGGSGCQSTAWLALPICLLMLAAAVYKKKE